MACSLENSVRRTLTAGHDSLECHTGAYEALGYDEICGVHFIVVFRICSNLVKELENVLASCLGGCLQNTASGVVVLASDEVENDLNLARGDADMLLCRSCFPYLLSPFRITCRCWKSCFLRGP